MSRTLDLLGADRQDGRLEGWQGPTLGGRDEDEGTGPGRALRGLGRCGERTCGNGDSYTLTYQGSTSVPIVRGQNNTAAGIAAALAGGSESQQVALGSFNAGAQSFQIAIGGTTSPTVFGLEGQAVNATNLQAAINA